MAPSEADGAGRAFPHYEMDHLATFSVGGKQVLMSPTDGIRKLRQMELSTGIWTMRVTLVIEPNDLIVIDRATGEDMERFPVNYITQLTAVTNEDRKDVYNNIVLFTITEEARRGIASEMHMFQCIARPAGVVVDDIKAAKAGKIRGPVLMHKQDRAPVNERVREFEQHAQHNYNATTDYHQAIPSTQLLQQSMRQEDNESVLSEHTDHDVQLLNHCFDDIEKFVGRLQSAAESYRELAARRRQRESAKKNNHPIGDGMLSMRSRPPSTSDFIDVFQKFKLSFNLLATLKLHIHDLIVPELIHFLFTPLSLVVEASKDPRHGTPDIASKVLSPMLTIDAKELLLNCLSSKETDLWYSLGDAWKLSRGEYKEYVPPFYPRFSDGWEPPRSCNAKDRRDGPPRRHDNEEMQKPDPYARRNGQAHGASYNDRDDMYDRLQEKDRQRTLEREPDYNQQKREPHVPPVKHSAPATFAEQQQEYLDELQNKKSKVAEVKKKQEGKNPKELSVQKGEIVEVLNSSKNWWKVRNNKGQSGHVPFNVLKELPGKSNPVHH